jgi:SNF family Na+-dependent transporter
LSAHTHAQERWATRIGLILAMAGNAVGLGNFLRFPVQAAQNGGGTFMIPYFISFLLLGIPLMWVEWTIGRFGGRHGHATIPGMFDELGDRKRKWAKYLGVLGIVMPLVVFIYYTYVVSWMLGFSFFSLTGGYFGLGEFSQVAQYLYSYQDVHHDRLPLLRAVARHSRGHRKARANRDADPLLVRVHPHDPRPDAAPSRGHPSGRAQLHLEPRVDQPVGREGLAGGSRPDVLHALPRDGYDPLLLVLPHGEGRCDPDRAAIPAAVTFFGVAGATAIAEGGTYDLGIVAMSVVFQGLPGGQFWGQVTGFLWFFLLFIAGITSSVALSSPAIAFLQQEYGRTRKHAVLMVMALAVGLGTLHVLFYHRQFLDVWDYWAGTFGLVIFAAVEIVLFSWIFGIDRGWKEMHIGADLRVPLIYKFIIKWVTPIFLFILLGWWAVTEAVPTLLMRDVEDAPIAYDPETIVYRWFSRLVMLGLLALGLYLIHQAWVRKAVVAGASPGTDPGSTES